MQKSIYNRVEKLLEAANVCRRCLLRFYGIKQYTSYKKENVENAIDNCLKEEENNVVEIKNEVQLSTNSDIVCPPQKRILLTPCAACLGILQDIDSMIEKVEVAVNESQHKFQDFVLHIALPVVCELRDKLFLYYLKAELGESYSHVEREIPSVKDICKWVIGSKYGEITKTDFKPDSDFQIFLSSTYQDTVNECLVLLEKCPKAFPNARRKRKSEEDIYTKTAILNAMDALSSSIHELYALPPLPPMKSCTFNEIQCTHSPLYLGGRYNKYSRELSQTPWIVDGERRMDSSVSELITDVVQKHIISDKIVFSASGREDVDVKMLGNGRPFVLEIINPRNMQWSLEKMKNIEHEINESTKLICVKHLQVISKDDTSILKEGEEKKRKTYSALCIVKKLLTQTDIDYLNNLKDVKMLQSTPIRVLHRRTLAKREKVIYSMKGKLLSEHQLQLAIEAQAGTYIKEFVHGDFLRTVPNLGTILNTEADILELDVENIDLEWPPKTTL